MAIYELMKLITREGKEIKTVSEATQLSLKGKRHLDSEPLKVGTALDIVKLLLKEEIGKKYKLVKKVK